mgnify:CR=1 FL=1
MAEMKDPAVSVCFKVKIDEFPLGMFNSCEGLGCEIVLEQREEGGNNAMIWQLPTRMKFTNVKLSRPIGEDSKHLTSWFASMMSGVKPTTMVISAMTADETRALLLNTRRIAVVGASDRPDRPSNEVFGFLQSRGYDVVDSDHNTFTHAFIWGASVANYRYNV